MSKEKFYVALNFLFPSEGGYSNHKADSGGATNMGITQSTYNAYQKKKNLKSKDVKFITKSEAEQIYYENYWLSSGADKISDTKMAVVLFDTAVLHGVSKAKEYYQIANGDLGKYIELRNNSYDIIVARNKSQLVFYKGWKNRVNNLRKYIAKIK